MPAPRLLTPQQIIIATGGAYIVITSTPGATLTCGSDSYTLGSAEASHAFEVNAGTYACTAALSGYTTATQTVTITGGVTEITLKPYLLPAEYQQVQFLKSDGQSYMFSSSLGVSTNQTIKIGCIVDDLSGSSADNCTYIYGCPTYLIMGYWYGYVTVGNASSAYNWNLGEEYEFSVTSNTLYINGATTGLTRNTSHSQGYLFINNPQTSVPRRSVTISYCKKYDSSNSLLLNFLPCYRKSDYIPGFYDTINNIFITNANSIGGFICGEDVN